MTKVWVRIALLLVASIVMSDCFAEPPVTKKSERSSLHWSGLEGTAWQVEDIDSSGIIDRSMITMGFAAGGRIVGSTGCNRYFGTVTVSEGLMSLHGIGSTRRACPPALMSQEQRFLAALSDAARFANDNDRWLLVYDQEGVERIRGIRVRSDPTTAKPAPQDIGSAMPVFFDCEVKVTVSIQFVGPETVELTVGDRERVLTLERTASGARYSGDGLEFWNKGDEALLTIGEEKLTCKRR